MKVTELFDSNDCDGNDVDDGNSDGDDYYYEYADDDVDVQGRRKCSNMGASIQGHPSK